jgi:hypothetical protein
MERIIFEARRYSQALRRTLGIWGMAMLGCVLISALVSALAHPQSKRIANTPPPLARHKVAALPAPPTLAHVDALASFEERLLPPEDLPLVVKKLLQSAEKQGLAVQRGTYRPQVDPVGRFMRYRMSMPVQGAAVAIQTWLHDALLQEKMLALESVQFKRESAQTSNVEARIAWLVFTRMPSALAEPTP